MFQAVSPPIIRSSKTVQATSGMCKACLLLLLAVAASKLGTYINDARSHDRQIQKKKTVPFITRILRILQYAKFI